MNIKRKIKVILTFIWHPIITIRLMLVGCRDFCIGRRLIINGIGGFKYFRIGKGSTIGCDSRLLFVTEYQGESFKPQITIGNNVSVGNRFSCLSAASILIEDNCLIASDVLITSENHGLDLELSNSYANTKLSVGEVHIHEGCWIGEKVSIMPGVSLGKRCVVATNAVVTKSFPGGIMLAGIPARPIKKYNFEMHKWENVN